MSKKQDSIYFENFIACAGYASQAAQLLKEIFRNFDPAQMPAWMEQIHDIEHTADKKRHAMTDQLAHAFITPHRAGGHLGPEFPDRHPDRQAGGSLHPGLHAQRPDHPAGCSEHAGSGDPRL